VAGSIGRVDNEEGTVSVDGSTAADGPATGRGNRRIDRVLAEDFLVGLTALPLSDVRARRADAEQEEVDLSYLRRMVQGRVDVLRAELRRRDTPGDRSLVEGLADILADEPRAPARGSGRYSAVEPSRADSHRRYGEALVADIGLSDVSSRSTAELAEDLRTLAREEHSLSSKRRAVQQVMDDCSAEIARRYRDGEADVNTLLAEQPSSAGGASG